MKMKELIDLLKQSEESHGEKGNVKRFRIEIGYSKSSHEIKHDELWDAKPGPQTVSWGKSKKDSTK